MKHRTQTKINKLSKQVALRYTNAYQNIPKEDQWTIMVTILIILRRS